jgi:hypothetical protein
MNMDHRNHHSPQTAFINGYSNTDQRTEGKLDLPLISLTIGTIFYVILHYQSTVFMSLNKNRTVSNVKLYLMASGIT